MIKIKELDLKSLFCIMVFEMNDLIKQKLQKRIELGVAWQQAYRAVQRPGAGISEREAKRKAKADVDAASVDLMSTPAGRKAWAEHYAAWCRQQTWAL